MNERLTTAGILIKDGCVLVAKRDQGHGHDLIWEIPGGKNRYGETLEATLVREWKEELGLDIKVHENIASCEFENNGTIYHLKAFRITCEQFDELKLCEHSEVKFVDKNEQRNLEMMNSDKQIFETVWLKLENV